MEIIPLEKIWFSSHLLLSVQPLNSQERLQQVKTSYIFQYIKVFFNILSSYIFPFSNILIQELKVAVMLAESVPHRDGEQHFSIS